VTDAKAATKSAGSGHGEALKTKVASLKQAGVKFFMEPFDTPVCRMAMVLDPAGNAHQTKR
jgi:hypothetical protein